LNFISTIKFAKKKEKTKTKNKNGNKALQFDKEEYPRLAHRLDKVCLNIFLSIFFFFEMKLILGI